jgi:protein-L-isoaspartate(D-aspartate) O-methyltransferase
MPDTLPDPDFAAARTLMVDGQLRPNKVSNARLLAALRRLPRELFVPPALAEFAYMDDDLRISPAGARPVRAMCKPLVLARLIQLAAPRDGETALVVGAGTGYGAVLLAACGAHVTALEEDEALVAQGRQAAAQSGAEVSFVTGRLADGCSTGAPYDIVLIEGAVRAIPERLARLVAQNGRLVAVLAPAGGMSVAVLAEPTTGGLSVRPAFDAAAPLLPGLLPAPAFQF